MGLYLAVFDDDEEEIDGVECGSYGDYAFLIDAVVRELEGGSAGSKYPVLTLHSDCDGEWSTSDCAVLIGNLREIGEHLQRLPPVPFHSDWQRTVALQAGRQCRSLYDCFIDVDGEPLIARIIDLCQKAVSANRPITFQ